MSQSPFEQAGILRIGAVDYVSPDGITVALDIETPESVALNAGTPRPFPRVNGYLLIPVDDAFLVGQVEWMIVERSPFPKRQGMQRDFGLIDLPYPTRKLRLNPLGTLRKRANKCVFSRGADALPSVGVAVILPTKDQLRSIVESGEHHRVKIGTSPLADHADVWIDPNRLFGRHLAVLGNTGSGKSCSVAGLIRWSIEKAKAEKQAEGIPNARFIVLDPNGEYSRAFGVRDKNSDNPLNARVFKVNPDKSKGELPLQVPLWFWNSTEWCSFTQASEKTQRPLLRIALRESKAGMGNTGELTEAERKLNLHRVLTSKLDMIQTSVNSGEHESTKSHSFGRMLTAIREDVTNIEQDHPDQREDLEAVKSVISAAVAEKSSGKGFFDPFTDKQASQITDALQKALNGLGKNIYPEGLDEDIPLKFDGADLANYLERLARQENARQYLDPLIARLRAFLSDSRMKAIISDTGDLTLETWLNEYIGGNQAKDGCVSVIDLSLVPTEIVHVITAVIARMVFEAQQRYVKLDEKKRPLPTVIVMEEAHTFVKRTKDDTDDEGAASICCQAFEKIAREGRKFGLGLVVSSQRPSELSPTVLSQCNSFLLHRISNDRDQERVQRLVPDNLRGIMRELPLLPSQNAILLGWASELPVLVKMNDLPELQQPRSKDPDFWEVWVGKDDKGKAVDRSVDWEKIANDWRNLSTGKSGNGG